MTGQTSKPCSLIYSAALAPSVPWVGGFIHNKERGRVPGDLQKVCQLGHGFEGEQVRFDGGKTTSARRAASAASVAEWGGVSITMKSTPWASACSIAAASLAAWVGTTHGCSVSRRSVHLEAVACGSISITATVCPFWTAATAKIKGNGGFTHSALFHARPQQYTCIHL